MCGALLIVALCAYTLLKDYLSIVILCVGCLGVASSVSAQSKFAWTPAVALAAGQSLDAISTVRFLNNGSGCTESNRFVGAHPSAWTLVAQKAAVVGLGVGILKLTGKSASKPIRVIGQVFNYALAGTGTKSAIRNASLCGF